MHSGSDVKVLRCFLLHNFFKFFVNQGRLCLDEVKECGTNYVLIISVILEVTKFHLSLTVMLSFNIKKFVFKVIQVFQNASIVSFISNENVAFRAAFALGEMLIPDISQRLALSILTLCRYRQNTEIHRHTETQSQ